MQTLLYFLVVLVVLVLAHELGHFITAKRAGVKVLEFGFGFPPRLLAVRRGETDYSVNLLPLGGFVKMVGEEDPSEPRSLAAQRAGTRILVMSAGALMNLLLALALFTGGFMVPRTEARGEVLVRQVVAGSPAAGAGIQPGDVILAIGGRQVDSIPETRQQIYSHLGQEIPLVLLRKGTWGPPPEATYWETPTAKGLEQWRQEFEEVHARPPTELDYQDYQWSLELLKEQGRPPLRADWERHHQDEVSRHQRPYSRVPEFVRGGDGEEVATTATPRLHPPEGEGALGILLGYQNPRTVTVAYPLWEAAWLAVKQSVYILDMTRSALIGMFFSGDFSQLAGPVGIAQATGEVASSGLLPLLEWTAILSLNLAVINIMPIPMLDGGRIFFVLIEVARRGRRIPPEREALVHAIGFALLMALMVLISYNDIVRWLSGGTLLQ